MVGSGGVDTIRIRSGYVVELAKCLKLLQGYVGYVLSGNYQAPIMCLLPGMTGHQLQPLGP